MQYLVCLLMLSSKISKAEIQTTTLYHEKLPHKVPLNSADRSSQSESFTIDTNFYRYHRREVYENNGYHISEPLDIDYWEDECTGDKEECNWDEYPSDNEYNTENTRWIEPTRTSMQVSTVFQPAPANNVDDTFNLLLGSALIIQMLLTCFPISGALPENFALASCVFNLLSTLCLLAQSILVGKDKIQQEHRCLGFNLADPDLIQANWNSWGDLNTTSWLPTRLPIYESAIDQRFSELMNNLGIRSAMYEKTVEAKSNELAEPIRMKCVIFTLDRNAIGSLGDSFIQEICINGDHQSELQPDEKSENRSKTTQVLTDTLPKSFRRTTSSLRALFSRQNKFSFMIMKALHNMTPEIISRSESKKKLKFQLDTADGTEPLFQLEFRRI